MPADQARRGRPKGSGLDDTDLLKRVAGMLEADPDLKPTTAIKAMGISDPSTIRRLRDKLRGTGASEDGAIIHSRKVERAKGGESHRHGRAINAARHFIGAISAGDEVAPGFSESAEHETTMAVQGDGARGASSSWFAAWCGLGLHALSTTVEAQIAVFESLLSVPQIASAIRHQALLSEQVMAFYSYSTDVRTTLH